MATTLRWRMHSARTNTKNIRNDLTCITVTHQSNTLLLKQLLPGPFLVPAAQVGQATLEQLGSHGGHLSLVLEGQVKSLPDGHLPPDRLGRVVLVHHLFRLGDNSD